MTVAKYLEECFRTGVQPAIPVIIIANDDGQVSIKTMSFKDFYAAYRSGDFRSRNFLTKIPRQDENGRWLDVPQGSMLVIKGLIAGRDLMSAIN